jgi:GT2 family glycosyltransferase
MLGTGSNLFFRKSAVDETGFFDESFDRFQDVEYMIRFANKHAIGILDDVLIVKENTGLHMIEYSKLRNATYNFVGKFNEYINSFSKDEQNNFFVKRFTKLLYSAFANGSIADIQEATAALMNYRALTTKENKTIMNIEKYRERRSIKERLLLLGNQLGLLKKLKRKQSKLVFSQLSDDKIRSIYKML